MSENQERAATLGETGGLPGANADPRTARLSDDEMADTVSTADTGAAEGDEQEDTDADGDR